MDESGLGSRFELKVFKICDDWHPLGHHVRQPASIKMEHDSEKKRHPLLAALLSLTGVPLGQLYGGQLQRAVVLAVVCLMVLPVLTFLLLRLPVSQFATLAILALILAMPILLAVDAFFVTLRKPYAQLLRYQRWWVYVLVFLTASFIGTTISFGIRRYVAEAFIVPGRAMLPTIQHNDRILVDKLFLDPSKLNRNDLAVYWSPDPESQLQLKRIMGLPGETIEVRDERLFIDGENIADVNAYYSDGHTPIPELTNYGPVTIPEKMYFVLGDNRRISKDSRLDGPIPFESFIGVPRVIYWSNDYEFYSDHGRPPICGAIRWDRIGSRLDGQPR